MEIKSIIFQYMLIEGCENVPGFDTKHCCQSCHDESEILGYPMGGTFEYDGNTYESMCCEASSYLESLKYPRANEAKNE